MDTYHVVLYIHVLALLLGFGAGMVVSVALFKLRAAQTAEQAAPWGMLAGQTEKVFPIAILALLATGAYMTSDVWTWGTGWIDVGIAGLAVLAVQGGGIAARRGHLVAQALQENGPGALGDRARRMARDRILWTASFANEGVVLAIVWNMTEKPGTAGSVAAVVIGWAVGATFAWRFSRAPAVEAVAVSEPA
ncbi:MAG TPA: hypothetical protein VKC62_03540 [Gaiellaceae bacterium]|nr:hypothetical protein [Gaiellaceae bacterium]